MCGILGYFCFGNERPYWENLFYSWQSMTPRGVDGCGFVYPNSKGGLTWMKSKTAVDKFVVDDNEKGKLATLVEEAPKYAFFHVRKSTVMSKVDSDHAHPFFHKDIAIVHNGIIRNANTLAREYNVDNPDIDSEIIPHHYLNHKITESNSNFKTALEKLIGDFTIAAMSVKTPDKLWLGTNGERPLDLAYDASTNILYFCSEYQYIDNLFYYEEETELELLGLKAVQSKKYLRGEDPYIASYTTPTLIVIDNNGCTVQEFKKEARYETYGSTNYNTGWVKGGGSTHHYKQESSEKNVYAGAESSSADYYGWDNYEKKTEPRNRSVEDDFLESRFNSYTTVTSFDSVTNYLIFNGLDIQVQG